MNGISYREASESMLLADKNVLKITYENGAVVEKYADTEFRMYYDEEDYITVAGKSCTMLVSITDINREIALEHIQNFVVIIFIVFSFMVFYTKHFVQNVSDVIHIMNAGFRKKDYNLLVKIPQSKSDHEIFRLAKFYNDAYLPAKMKKSDTGTKNSSLSMNDLMDFK